MVQLSPASIDKLQVPPSLAFPMTIEEVSGGFRRIVLRGSSLPFRGVSYPSAMRAELTYYPGNPQAEAQILGATWGPTELTGRWTDPLLGDDSAPLLSNFPAQSLSSLQGGGSSFESAGSIPTDAARRARIIRDAFFLIQRGGQLLKVTWGSVTRYGYMKEFDPEHQTENEIRWSATFEWTGDTESPAIVKKSLIPDVGAFQALVAAMKAALAAMNVILAQLYGNVTAVQQAITSIGSLVTGFIDAVAGFASLAFVPLDVMGTVNQQLTSIALAATDLIELIRSVPGAYNARLAGFNPTETALQEELLLAIIYNAQVLGADAIEMTARISETLNGEIIGIVIMPSGKSLRDLAREYYDGDAEAWTEIADYNQLASSVVPPGTPVRIPRPDR